MIRVSKDYSDSSEAFLTHVVLVPQIEGAGLDEKEMKILKEELDHHQLKQDQFYAFVDNLHETREKTPDMENHIGHFLEDEDVERKDKKGKSKDKTASSKKKPEVAEDVGPGTFTMGNCLWR